MLTMATRGAPGYIAGRVERGMSWRYMWRDILADVTV